MLNKSRAAAARVDAFVPDTVAGSGGAAPALADFPLRAAAPARAASRLLIAFCCLAVLAGVAAEAARWTSAPADSAGAAMFEAAAPRKVTLTSVSTTLIPMPPGVPSAHASAMAPLPGNQMLAFWWAGSRESGPDVKVYAARWAGGAWGQAREVASRASLAAALGFGVRRIGNPVVWTARDGSIHLYVVATGFGGWAASRVVQMVSSDGGQHFQVKRLLPLSPLFNTSVLVRTTPMALADGGWWLPAYFEIGLKYPMMMTFGSDGAPRRLARIGSRVTTLQPTLAPVSAFEAHAWMRDASDEQRVQQAVSRDGGASWQDLPPLDLPNYSSSLAARRLDQGGFLLLHNHVSEGASDRSVLRLSLSKDAHSWERILDVASGEAGEEFSYPTMQQVGNELHVSYTSRRTAIAHHVYRIDYGDTLL